MEFVSSSALPVSEDRCEGGEEASVLEKFESPVPEELLFLDSVVDSPVSVAGREDWLGTPEAATWVCAVAASGSRLPISRGPWDVPCSTREGAGLAAKPGLLAGRGGPSQAEVLPWEVRAVAVSGGCPAGETGKSVPLEEWRLPPASTASVRRLGLSGAPEEAAWLSLEAWPITPAPEATAAKSSGWR